MASTTDFRNGLIFQHKNGLWKIVSFLHVKPGKGPAFVRTKLKNIKTSQVVEEKFKKLLLHHNSTKESDDSVYITFINKSKNWDVHSVTITFEFNEDGNNEEIKLYGTPNYPINYQQKGKIYLYPNLRFGIRKNFKSWWIVGFMGKKDQTLKQS